MERKVTIKWGYSPEDFFEEEFSFEADNYKIEINSGETQFPLTLAEFEREVQWFWFKIC